MRGIRTSRQQPYSAAFVLTPVKLANLLPRNGTPRGTQGAMQAKLGELRDCSGIAGRDPQPTGSSYCE